MANRILIASDTHLCHQNWYGVSSEDRTEIMIRQMNDFYETSPYDALFFLGDYALDFWGWNEGGSYNHLGISNTKRFFKEYVPRLSCPGIYPIPGNHDQYGQDKWQAITGRPRRYSVQKDGILFILTDSFGADLDPDFDSDGTYTPADVSWIRTEMERCPGIPVILMSHYFDIEKETDAFKALLKDEDRILLMICGHTHVLRTDDWGEECGHKLLLHDGHFSYASCDIHELMWGFLILTPGENEVTIEYYSPENTIFPDGEEYSVAAGIRKVWHFPINRR